jgi:hypothetical protein
VKKIDQMYRSGIWTVKPGKVEEFIKTWQTSVEWLVENHPGGWGGEALLLQDIGSPYKFISFAWSTMPEKTEELLVETEFQSFMASIQELCEEIQPRRMRVVGYSSSQ